MSVFKDDMTTYTGNMTVLGSLNVGGALIVTGSITGGSIIVGGNPIVAATPITNSLSGNVALNSVVTYFAGPSIAQGTSGTWFASGTVTLTDTVAAGFLAKLWDGTTVIASAATTLSTGTGVVTISLSGYITAPVGNIRISVVDVSTVNGQILFSATGVNKDSTISAIRIA